MNKERGGDMIEKLMENIVTNRKQIIKRRPLNNTKSKQIRNQQAEIATLLTGHM